MRSIPRASYNLVNPYLLVYRLEIAFDSDIASFVLLVLLQLIIHLLVTKHFVYLLDHSGRELIPFLHFFSADKLYHPCRHNNVGNNNG